MNQYGERKLFVAMIVVGEDAIGIGRHDGHGLGRLEEWRRSRRITLMAMVDNLV